MLRCLFWSAFSQVFQTHKFGKIRAKFLSIMHFFHKHYKFVQESQFCKSVTLMNISHKNLITFLQILHLFVRNSYKNAICYFDQKFVQDFLDPIGVFFEKHTRHLFLN